MSEHNGNGKHEKPIELTRPKSPEEIAQEEVRRTMPRLRRECSRDPRLKKCVGAKWLFGQLSDNSFLNDFGGDGWGRVYTSLKDLHRIYGHSEDALAEWRKKLIETRWIWFQEMWPKSCWGISAVCRQPELFSPHSKYVRIMAKASANTPPSETAPPHPNDKTADSGHNDHLRLADQPPLTVTPTAADGQTNHQRRSDQPSLTVGIGVERRSDQPPETVTPTAADGQSDSLQRGTPTAADGHIEESPRSIGASGAFEGGKSHPPPTTSPGGKKSKEDWALEAWRRSLNGSYRSKVERIHQRLKQQRAAASAPNVQQFISRKLKILDELLDGPTPEAEAPAPVPTVKAPKKPEDPALVAKLKRDLRAAAGMEGKR